MPGEDGDRGSGIGDQEDLDRAVTPGPRSPVPAPRRLWPMAAGGLVGLLVLAGAGLALCLPARRGPRTGTPLQHQVYVWQRLWNAPVRKAVAGLAGRFNGLVVLGAEVSVRSAERGTGSSELRVPSSEFRALQVVRVPLDARTLALAGQPVGLALRIGPYAGPFDGQGPLTRLLGDLALSLVTEARARHLPVSELQLDFDCAERDLDGYRLWVEHIRRRVAPVPVTITALPCWTNRRAFAALAAAADGYVLQVHSLERPAAPDAPMVLCDPVAARRAVERSGRLGRPFRVALPTYGYLVAFDARGRFIGLSAEGPALAWDASVRVRELRADPEAMAGLVRDWTADRPACLQGLIWYRLPTEADALNWRPATLAAVMSGRAPLARMGAEARRPEPGLVEIDLVNSGEADGRFPGVVSARWDGARLLAGDAVQGFELARSDPAHGIGLNYPAAGVPRRLPPGERRMIGWLRLSSDAEVSVHVAP